MLLLIYVFMVCTERSVMVDVLIFRHVTTGDRVRSHVRPCGIYDVQSICATGLSSKTSIFFFIFQNVRDLLKFVHFLIFFNVKSEVQTQGQKHTRLGIFCPNSVLLTHLTENI